MSPIKCGHVGNFIFQPSIVTRICYFSGDKSGKYTDATKTAYEDSHESSQTSRSRKGRKTVWLSGGQSNIPTKNSLENKNPRRGLKPSLKNKMFPSLENPHLWSEAMVFFLLKKMATAVPVPCATKWHQTDPTHHHSLGVKISGPNNSFRGGFQQMLGLYITSI